MNSSTLTRLSNFWKFAINEHCCYYYLLKFTSTWAIWRFVHGFELHNQSFCFLFFIFIHHRSFGKQKLFTLGHISFHTHTGYSLVVHTLHSIKVYKLWFHNTFIVYKELTEKNLLDKLMHVAVVFYILFCCYISSSFSSQTNEVFSFLQEIPNSRSSKHCKQPTLHENAWNNYGIECDPWPLWLSNGQTCRRTVHQIWTPWY